MRALSLAGLCALFAWAAVGCKTPTAARPARAEASYRPFPFFPSKKIEKPPPALPALPVGEIRQVNAEGKFVLVDTGSAVAVQPGEMFLALSEGKITAELKLTELKSPPFMIADIVSGQPAAGQKVYRRD